MKKNLIIIAVFMAFIWLTGFNTENAIVSRNEILAGGPPKDGIPAISEPKFLKSNQADFLKDSDHIIGVRIGNEAKAYPIKILNWHEVVNDTIKGVPVVVTF